MQQPAWTQSRDGGRARLIVQQCQFADQCAFAEHGQQPLLTVDRDNRSLDRAAADQVAAVALVAGMEKYLLGAQGHRNRRLGKSPPGAPRHERYGPATLPAGLVAFLTHGATIKTDM